MPSDDIDATLAPGAAAVPGRRLGAILVPVALFAALAASPLLARGGAEALVLSLATRTAVLAIAAMSLDILIGACGLVSLGHAAFLGIGSYSVLILAQYGIDDIGAQLAVAIVAAFVFAAITGAVSLRTRGVQFIMITLAFAQMLFFFATSLAAFGGDDGMGLAARSTLFGTAVLSDDRILFAVSFAGLLGVYLLCLALVRSRFGRVLRGVRDNDGRMRAIGFAPAPFHFVAYLVSGTIASFAGVLLAETSEFVGPSVMSWPRSADLVLMVVLGGLGTLHGSILGAIVFVLVAEGLSRITENWHIVFGPLLIFAVLFLRGGLVRHFDRASR